MAEILKDSLFGVSRDEHEGHKFFSLALFRMVWFGLIWFDNRPQLKIAFFRGEEIFSQEFTKINPLGMHFFAIFQLSLKFFLRI